MAAMRRRLVLGQVSAVQVSGGKIWVTQEMTPAITPTRTKILRVLGEAVLQEVERPDRAHHKRSGDHRAGHVVRILHSAQGFISSPQKLVISNDPLGRTLSRRPDAASRRW